jgi:hypothetical protein
MDPDCMRQCMSLGYSMKTNSTTIGQCKLGRLRLFCVPQILLMFIIALKGDVDYHQ